MWEGSKGMRCFFPPSHLPASSSCKFRREDAIHLNRACAHKHTNTGEKTPTPHSLPKTNECIWVTLRTKSIKFQNSLVPVAAVGKNAPRTPFSWGQSSCREKSGLLASSEMPLEGGCLKSWTGSGKFPGFRPKVHPSFPWAIYGNFLHSDFFLRETAWGWVGGCQALLRVPTFLNLFCFLDHLLTYVASLPPLFETPKPWPQEHQLLSQLPPTPPPILQSGGCQTQALQRPGTHSTKMPAAQVLVTPTRHGHDPCLLSFLSCTKPKAVSRAVTCLMVQNIAPPSQQRRARCKTEGQDLLLKSLSLRLTWWVFFAI